MVMVPPRHYCVIANPVARNDTHQVLFDQSGQAKLRHADLEIRLTQDPFPLYPGEEIQQVCRSFCSWSLNFMVHHEDAEVTEGSLGFVVVPKVCLVLE